MASLTGERAQGRSPAWLSRGKHGEIAAPKRELVNCAWLQGDVFLGSPRTSY